jgi:UDP-2,3-diacylglucosamine pyrophosphatase LpxH
MSTCLVVSDLHLGTRVCRTDLLHELLDEDCDALVLNGDTIDSLNFNRFRPEDWRVFRRLRDTARKRELILVRGNHDTTAHIGADGGPLDVLAELLHTKLYEEFDLDVGGQPYLLLHGDQFDDTMNLTWVGDAADWAYRQIQGLSRRTALWLKGRVKHLGGVVRSVRARAVRHAAERGYAGVITGHTHYWDDQFVDGVHYLNTGCWVDWPCSYVRVEDGAALVAHWPERGRRVTEPTRSLAGVMTDLGGAPLMTDHGGLRRAALVHEPSHCGRQRGAGGHGCGRDVCYADWPARGDDVDESAGRHVEVAGLGVT